MELEYSRFYSFSARGLLKAPSASPGVYLIYRHRNCLYVGQAKRQSLYARLSQHFKACENQHLKLWLDADFELRYRYLEISEQQMIDRVERYLIRFLSPVCNIERYKNGY